MLSYSIKELVEGISDCSVCNFIIRYMGSDYYVTKNVKHYSDFRITVDHDYWKTGLGLTDSHMHLVDAETVQSLKNCSYNILPTSVEGFLRLAVLRLAKDNLKDASHFIPLYANQFPEEVSSIEPRPE